MSGRRPVLIIHYHPLELYPPAANLFRFMKEAGMENEAIWATTTPQLKLDLLEGTAKVRIVRTPSGNNSQALPVRLLYYFLFYWKVFWMALRLRPSSILYFETISAFPALLYKTLFPSVKLMVHYHEYDTEDHYTNGMVLVKYWHRWEKKMYPRFSWLSHTHPRRMELFLKDNPMIPKEITRVIPNYPGRAWHNFIPEQKSKSDKIRMVHAGVLTFDDLYLEEFVLFMKAHEADCELDLYSFSDFGPLKSFLEKHQVKNVYCKGFLDYSKLPGVMARYDVGLILYKGTKPNHTYSEPNKLFEYLALDLDVWFPKELSGSLQHVRETAWPKILALDFKKLGTLSVRELYDRTGLPYQPTAFYYQEVLLKLLEAFKEGEKAA